jgi:hypothetical protein
MNSSPPTLKIEMIERSMRCLTFGLISLIPAIGVPFAFASLAQSSKVKRLAAGAWNPGAQYRFWGAVLARIGLTLTCGLGIIIGILIYRPWDP